LRILHVASEVAPWSQTGGLADVTAGLPQAQQQIAGTTTFVLSPLYASARRALIAGGCQLTSIKRWPMVIGSHQIAATLVSATPYKSTAEHPQLLFLDCPTLYDRPGLYGDRADRPYQDNYIRYTALGLAAAQVPDVIGRIDVLHAHDWQAALAVYFAKQRAGIGSTVLTIHNLAFQGLCSRTQYDELGLPASLFNHRQFEFWGQANLLKGGIAHADVVTTVSPRYAQEILTPTFGEGLDGFLRFDAPRLVGIVNGIDDTAWNPATDACLARTYSVTDPSGKAACKTDLLSRFALTPPATDLLCVVVARLTAQKGVDLIAEAVPSLAMIGARLIVLGAGDEALENRFRYLAKVFSHHVSVTIGFDPALARRLYAGADVFLMPSRFEPCGLGQLYAMRYGSIPIVHGAGGLRDTVTDVTAGAAATGMVMPSATSQHLLQALSTAKSLFQTRGPNSQWTSMVTTAMGQDLSWRRPAMEYDALYRSVL
jgi:starch synthase